LAQPIEIRLAGTLMILFSEARACRNKGAIVRMKFPCDIFALALGFFLRPKFAMLKKTSD
jgi:hypothetical protein